jgi:hypothetical protein
MSEVVAFDRAGPRPASRRANRLALLAQIIEALEKLGGSAHYDLVINQIAAERRLVDEASRLTLRRQVLEVFGAHCETDSPEAEQLLFRKVYGADSRRWSFSREFDQRLRSGVINLDQHLR